MRFERRWLLVVGMGLAVGAEAATMPDPVEGVVTIEVTSGSTTYTSGIPSGTTKLVKSGAGEAILSAATADYSGKVEVTDGTLSLTDYDALGTGGKAAVAVSEGATFALKGADATSEKIVLYAGTITLAGSGCGSVGALYFAPTKDTSKNADQAFAAVKLSANAAVGGTARFGMKKINLNAQTLTLLNGGKYAFSGAAFYPGKIVFQGNVETGASECVFKGSNNFSASGCTQENLEFTVEENALVTLSTASSAIPAFWSVAGTIKATSGTAVNYNRLTGTVKLMANPVAFTSDGGSLNVNGKVDLNGKTLTRYNSAPTYFAGPIDGSAAGSKIAPWRGDFIFTGNVSRVISDTTTLNSQGLTYGASLVEVDGGSYLSSQLRCGYDKGYRGIFSLKSGYAGFGSATIGFNGNDTKRPNGVFRMSGGTFNCGGAFTMCGSDDEAERRSQAFFLQSGGLFALTNEESTTQFDVGHWGNAIMRVSGGTNSTIVSSGTTRRVRFLGCAGRGTACVTVEGAASRVETESAKFLQETSAASCTLSLKNGGAFCAKRFSRCSDFEADSPTAVFNLISDGGVFKPLLANAVNNYNYSSNPEICEKMRPNNTVLLEKGLVIDLSECLSFSSGTGDSEIAWRFKKPTGKSLKSITLPTDVASLDYFEPAMIVVEGAGFGAAAYCDVDRSTKKLTAPVILCAGSGYDETTTRVTVYAPDSLSTYPCAFELEAAKSGPLTLRGSDNQLSLPMPGNTWDGGIIVEQGTLKLGTNVFVEGTAISLGDAQGHRGELKFSDGEAHSVSTLSGCGKLTLDKGGSVTVGTAYTVDGAWLGSNGGVTVSRTLTFASDSKISVSNVAALTCDPVTLVAAGTINGEPTVEITGTGAEAWKIVRRNNKYILKRRGFSLIIY